MLPAENRLRSSEGFRTAVRRGRRAGSRTLVVHLWIPDPLAETGAAAPDRTPDPQQVGFVVSKAVGNAVIRNRVKRRLRHLAREHVASLPGSAVLVVRALPGSAAATGAELAADLDRCLSRVRL